MISTVPKLPVYQVEMLEGDAWILVSGENNFSSREDAEKCAQKWSIYLCGGEECDHIRVCES